MNPATGWEGEQCSLSAAAFNGFKCHHPITGEWTAVTSAGDCRITFFRDLAVDFPDYFDKQNKFM